MKILKQFVSSLFLLSSTFAYSHGSVPCLTEYENASGGLFSWGVEIIPFIGQNEAILSYRGPRLFSYDGHEFNTYQGKIKTHVREVTREKTLSKEGAALVAMLLDRGHDDYDWAVVQYMALELRNDFPRLMMDGVVYHILSRDMSQDLFCRNKLWTWSEIKKWMKETGVPRYLQENPDTDISKKPICKKLPGGGADCRPR